MGLLVLSWGLLVLSFGVCWFCHEGFVGFVMRV